MKARGLKGEVLAQPDALTLHQMKEGATVYVAGSGDGLFPLGIERVRVLNNGLGIQFQGLSCREEAEALARKSVYVPRASLPQLPDGEYYHADILGSLVWDPDGHLMGCLVDVLATGGTDVWVVAGEADEVLLPATRETVIEVNKDEGYIVARPPQESD